MERVYSAAESAEFQRRHDQLTAAMKARGVEQLVLTSTESIFYLTGATAEPLERPFFLVIDAARDKRSLLVPLLEQEHHGGAAPPLRLDDAGAADCVRPGPPRSPCGRHRRGRP